MMSGVGEVNKRTGAKVVTVLCPNDIILYQKYMNRVDRGDQHRVVGTGFANVDHFKKWYKRHFLVFVTSQAFTAWNMESERRYRGAKEKR